MKLSTRIEAAIHCLRGTFPRTKDVAMVYERRVYTGEQMQCNSFRKFAKPGGKGRTQMLYVMSWRDRFKCRYCGEEAWNVHHILKRAEYPHWANEVNNMISLCKKHHLLADNGTIPVETLFNLIPTD